MRRFLAFPLVIALGLTSLAGAKKKPVVIVRFYAEVAENNGDVFGTPVPLLDGSGSIRVSKVATISEQDVVAFTPFQNADGSLGAYFYLDQHGKLLLETLSMESRGKVIVALVNGRHVADLLIDKRISDGIAVVPSGLTPQDIDGMRKKFKLKEGANATSVPVRA
ncbi:MAG TPA: hypothetical protein VF585_03455 [Chthoniobacterales bacterium]|jgi:hypothetical protein